MLIGPWIANNTTGGRLMLALLGAAGAVTGLSSRFVSTAALLAAGGALLVLHRRQGQAAALHRQELALRKELLAYLLFNGSPRSLPAADLGRQISRMVAVRSCFGRAALMVRDGSGRLAVAGSAGFDDLSVEALNRWGESVSGNGLSIAAIAAGKERVATSSFTLTLDRRCAERNPLSTMSCKTVHIVPMRTAHGMIGALVVCTSPRAAGRESKDPLHLSDAPARLPLADRLQPLEALALRLTMQLAAPEDVTPVWPARSLPRQERHSRPARDRQARGASGSGRRSAEESVSPLGAVSTATALDRVRRLSTPATPPLPCVTGVSGRPPMHAWR